MSAGEPFDEFLKQVCPPRGLDWRKYRRASRRKVMHRIRELGLSGLGEYARYLDDAQSESKALPNLLRVTLSRFYREKEVWQSLAADIVPGLVGRIGSSRPLQVLSIGCCNGEEPYTMALIWKSEIEPCFPEAEIKVTALDVDSSCLNRARAGLYSGKTLREVPPHILSTWFFPEASGYRLVPSVRQMVDLTQCDMLKDPLPKNQDLIFCRYLIFTYFQGRRRMDLVRKIVNALNPQGFLVLGRKEGLEPQETPLLKPVQGLPCVYRPVQGSDLPLVPANGVD